MKIRDLLIWFGGLGLGILLMVADELISLSLYCGLACKYQIPLLGSFSIWDTWAMTFGLIVVIVTLTLAGFGEKQ